MTDVKKGFLTVAQAFSEKEIFDMVRGAMNYTQTLIEETIKIPFEDVVAELWTDQTLMHTPKIDPYRLKHNQRSFVMRGMVWRFRDYLMSQQFEGLAVSLPERSTIRKIENGEAGDSELLEMLTEGAQYNIDSDEIDENRSISEMLEVANLHSIVRRRNPTIWGIMVAAGLAEDDSITVRTLTQVKDNLHQRMKLQAKKEGRRAPSLTKQEFVQHIKLEVRSFCRATDQDFDEIWSEVSKLLTKLRGSRGVYKKKVA